MKRLMIKYLGEMEEEDLIMFVLEHLKDHKSPHKLIEGLEPVRHFLLSSFYLLLTNNRTTYSSRQVLEEEAVELVIGVWRQIIFESMAYNEGLLTEKALVD